MAAALRIMIAILLVCIPWMALAVSPQIRREQQPDPTSVTQVYMSSEGTVALGRAHVIRSEADTATEASTDTTGDTGNETASSSTAPAATVAVTDDTSAEEEPGDNFCDYDFPLGKDLTAQCAKVHHMVIDPGDCRQAAIMAGVNITNDFQVPYDFYRYHPEGCFTVPCHEAKWLAVNPLGQCYFYNPTPTKPDLVRSGTPVCKRAKIVNGTTNTNGGCGDGYQPVRTEAKCREFAACLGHCIGTAVDGGFQINLLNASEYNNYPKYCFIRHHEYDNCVYWNEPRPGMADPTNPVGTPLCNVSEITHFPPQQSM